MENQLNYHFRILEKYPGINIIHHRSEDGTLWATSGRNVVIKNEHQWQPFTRFPVCLPRDLFGFSRPTSRAMRSDKCNVFVNSSRKVMGIRGGMVYALEKGLPARSLFSIQGDCVLHRSLCEDQSGWTIFGEYFMNPQRQPVRIWRVSPGLDQWEIAHEFKSNAVRHVHGVFRDPFEKETFWVTVGDLEGECHLLCTADRFKSFRTFGDGSQNYRAVNLFFTRDHINWLTDSNLKLNHAFRLHRKTEKVEMGQELDCSVWYGCPTREKVFVAFTTVERGPAILSQASSVLVSKDAFNWEKVYSFKKDIYKPVQLFKYGVISCPSGELSVNGLYLSGEGLVGLDGSSIQASIEKVEKFI
jgi:hypothetical protein